MAQVPQVTVGGIVYEYEDSHALCEGNHPGTVSEAIRRALEGGVDSVIHCEATEHKIYADFNPEATPPISIHVEAVAW